MPDDFRKRIRDKVLKETEQKDNFKMNLFGKEVFSTHIPDWMVGDTQIEGDATIEALKEPGRLFNRGVKLISEGNVGGAVDLGHSIGSLAFTIATVPLGLLNDALSTTDKLMGATTNGKASGVGNFISEGINNVFGIIPKGYMEAEKLVDSGLRKAGVDVNKLDKGFKNGLIASYLMPPNATEEDFNKMKTSFDEAGQTTATIGVLEGIGKLKGKEQPPINVIPKTELPQDVKQTLQIEAPKKDIFNKVEVDPTGRGRTIPKTENTQAYTKMELLRDEVSTKKDGLVKDRDGLKKRAFDKDLTKQERIDAKNKLKEVSKELKVTDEKLSLLNKELEAKKFEVESKVIPQQKQLTEGNKTIPTENAPTSIDFSTTGEPSKITTTTKKGERTKTVEGLPEEKGLAVTKDIRTPEDFRNATTPEITNFVKKEIGIKEYNKIVEEAANRPENKTPVEGKNKAGQDITEVDMQAVAIEDAVYAKAQEIIYEKTKVETPKSEVKPEKIKTIEELDKERDAEYAQERAKWDKIEQEEKAITNKANLEKKDLYGFEDGKTPLRLGKIAEVLNKKWKYNDKILPRKDILKELVDNGDILNETKQILGKPNELGTVVGRKLNKTEADFVQYLIDNKTKQPPKQVTGNATIDRLKAEAKREIEGQDRLGSGQIFNPKLYLNSIKWGADIFKQGATKFADWSAQMVKDLGEKIKPHLLRIWSEVKKFGEDLGKIAVDKIGEFVESKYNPARPMKMVDQSLFEKVKKPYKNPDIKTNPNGAFGEAMKDIAKKDRETIKNEYWDATKDKEKIWGKIKNIVEEVKTVKKVAKTVLEPFTTSLEKVSKEVFQRYRLFQSSYDLKRMQRHTVIGDYFEVKEKSGLKGKELSDYNISLLNGWFDDAKKIAKKYGFESQLEKALKMKDDIAKELGIKTIENHFPRMVKDYEKFVKFIEEKYPEYYRDNFSRMIGEKATKLGRELTFEEQATLINNALRGYNPGITLSDVGNMKKRVIETLDGEFGKFYHEPGYALLEYVNKMTELSEARKFFGKGFDVNESIGAYIQQLRDGKKIDIEGSRELMDLFKSRFNQRTITNKGILALRDIGVVTKLGNPYATMTQLKDLAYSMYHDPLRTLPKAGKILSGVKPEWQIKELGIDPLKIVEEIANPKKRAKYVQKFLDYSGFSKLDLIGKETLINVLWDKYQRQSKQLKLNTEFERRIERYFGKGEEKVKVLKDLREGKKTDSTAFLLYNELVGAQPISLGEMPRGYLRGGNWRIAYFLKTFSIRQLDFALNETVRVMRDKSLPKEQRKQGAYNLMKLTTSMVLVGATVDQVRSLIMNKLFNKDMKQSYTDDMIDNFLNIALLSKYDYSKARYSGIEGTIGSKLLPPMSIIGDPLLVDLPNIIGEKGKALKTTNNIPLIGRFLYEYLKNKDSRTSRTSSRNTRR